jgi:putative addiction module CopG family antidote
MEVRLTPDQEAFVRQGIAAGRFQSEADAMAEALALWEERERRRAEILAAVDEAEASLARGEGHVLTEDSVREFVDDIKRRGLARLKLSGRCDADGASHQYQAKAELEGIWHYLATESGSVEVGHRLLALFGDKFRRFLNIPFWVVGATICGSDCVAFRWVTTLSFTASRVMMF